MPLEPTADEILTVLQASPGEWITHQTLWNTVQSPFIHAHIANLCSAGFTITTRSIPIHNDRKQTPEHRTEYRLNPS